MESNRPIHSASSSSTLIATERRTVRDAASYRITLAVGFVILAAVCRIWYKHYDRFVADRFFLAYNLIVYAALVSAPFYTAYYQWRVHRLIQRLGLPKTELEPPSEDTQVRVPQ